VIGVQRLDDARKADRFERVFNLVLRANPDAFRDGHAHVAQKLFRRAFVSRDFDGNHIRFRGRRRLNALLVNAVAELYERLVVQTNIRDAARFGFFDNRAGRRTETNFLADFAHFLHVDGDFVFDFVDRFAFGDVQKKTRRSARGVSPDFFFVISENDVVNSVLARLARSAVADVHSGERLQFEREMLDNVSRPGAFLDAAQESAFFLITASVRHQARHRFG
jgi:predicted nucleic acid-binding protein